MRNFLFILFILPLFASAQDQMFDICPLKVGETVPGNLEIKSQDGKKQALNSILDEGPTVVIFYRGGWCPYCTRHLAEIQAAKEEIEKLGYRIIAITPDKPGNLSKSLEKSKNDYPIYSDSELNAINAFGLGWKIDDALYSKYTNEYKMDVEKWSGEDHHILPVPGVYVIKDGKVVFNYVNPKYSTRLKAETLVAVLKTLSSA